MLQVPFHDWDESIYAQVGKEITTDKHLNMSYNGFVWLEKPPLFIYMIAVTHLLFGQQVFWPRLITLLMSVLLFFLTYQLSKQIVRNLFSKELDKISNLLFQLYCLVPSLALASTGFFTDRATIINMDIFLATAWMGYFVYRNNFRGKLIFLTLGVMTKSFLGFYPFILDLFFNYTILLKPREMLKNSILIVLPLTWHICSLLLYGYYFVQQHILDHMFSRVLEPIELHFGNKNYYFEYLYRDMNWIVILVGITVVLLAIDVLIRISKQKLSFFKNEINWYYVVLISPIPYLIFLTLSKSKLYWYLYSITPLFCLSLIYLLFRIKNKYLMIIFTSIFTIYFFISFLSATYTQVLIYTPPEKTRLAMCMQKIPETNIFFLINNEERIRKNLLEASKMAIQTSFIYGGSPAFIYYVNKPVHFIYKPEEILAKYKSIDLLVINESDFQNSEFTKVRDTFAIKCKEGEWYGLKRTML